MKFNLLKNDYIFSILNKAIALITGFITAALLNRYLGPVLKGEYTYIMNIVNFVSIFGNLGIYQSYPKSHKENMPQAKEKYVTLIYFQFAVYLIMAFIIGIVSGNLTYSIAFIIVPTQVIANQLSMIIMVEDIRYRQYVHIITQIVKTLIVLIIALLTPASLCLVFIILLGINILQCALYLMKLLVIPSFVFWNSQFILHIIKFGIYASIAELLLIMNYKADIIMLKFHVDYYQIGLYSVGAGIAECIWMIPDAFKEVLFSRTSRGNPIKEINLTIKVNMLVSIIIIGCMLILGKEAILIYAGHEYLEAIQVTQIILFGVPAMALFKITNPLYLANGKQKLYCLILAISVLANVLMNIILIPIAGIIGAAFASVVSFSICGITFYAKYIKEYQVSWHEPLFIRKKDINDIILLFSKGEYQNEQ